MYTAGQKDPDFILRPSGEKRLSNFMLWQAAYRSWWRWMFCGLILTRVIWMPPSRSSTSPPVLAGYARPPADVRGPRTSAYFPGCRCRRASVVAAAILKGKFYENTHYHRRCGHLGWQACCSPSTRWCLIWSSRHHPDRHPRDFQRHGLWQKGLARYCRRLCPTHCWSCFPAIRSCGAAGDARLLFAGAVLAIYLVVRNGTVDFRKPAGLCVFRAS